VDNFLVAAQPFQALRVLCHLLVTSVGSPLPLRPPVPNRMNTVKPQAVQQERAEIAEDPETSVASVSSCSALRKPASLARLD
jgi:hypothetical protein